jgi:hypothetical protein
VSTEYLVMELSPRACNARAVTLSFHYDATATFADFSHAVSVPLVDGDAPTIVLSPVYYAEASHFDRIEASAEEASCLTSVSRIPAADVPAVLIDAYFTPHWRDGALFQTIRQWETPNTGESLPALYLSPPSLTVPRHLQPLPFVSPEPSGRYLAPIVKTASSGALTVKGRPEGPMSYVIVIKDQRLAAGSMLVCEGVVREGGVTVGLLRNEQWARSVNVGTAGPFVAAVAVDATDTYTVVVANFVKGHQENDVAISSLGWLPPPRNRDVRNSR